MSDKDLAPIKHTGIIEYYWVNTIGKGMTVVPRVMVRLCATNGEQVAQITQGAKDKRDARRSVEALAFMFGGDITALQQVGPGTKPGTKGRTHAPFVDNLPDQS